jgi:hypothetical protein
MPLKVLLAANQHSRLLLCSWKRLFISSAGMVMQRWGYSATELAEALVSAESDRRGWLIWTERDERDFGSCITPAGFAAQYVRIRGLA